MKKVLFLMASLVMLFMFSSCATILSGKKQKVFVNGNVVSPVQLIVDGEVYNSARLPVEVKVKRNAEPSTIIAFTDNYGLESMELEKTFNPMILGNLVFPSFAVVDWLSGANKKTARKEIYLEFKNVCTTDTERSDSYNDFGVECFNADYFNVALAYFQKANEIEPTNELFIQNITAAQNRMAYWEEQQRLKAQRDEALYGALMGIGAALNTAGAMVGNNQASSNNYSGSNSNNQSNSNSSPDASYYQTYYNKYEDNVKKCYDSLSPNKFGTLTVNDMMKKNIRFNQNEMKKLRQEAKRKGIIILQSGWENWNGTTIIN